MMVRGQLTDDQTRCIHWHSPVDIVAIKFKCCNTYYACYECHNQLTDHKPEVWSRQERNEKAVMCGVCKKELSVREYFDSSNSCPGCHSAFNPKCRSHYHLYFEM